VCECRSRPVNSSFKTDMSDTSLSWKQCAARLSIRRSVYLYHFSFFFLVQDLLWLTSFPHLSVQVSLLSALRSLSTRLVLPAPLLIRLTVPSAHSGVSLTRMMRLFAHRVLVVLSLRRLGQPTACRAPKVFSFVFFFLFLSFYSLLLLSFSVSQANIKTRLLNVFLVRLALPRPFSMLFSLSIFLFYTLSLFQFLCPWPSRCTNCELGEFANETGLLTCHKCPAVCLLFFPLSACFIHLFYRLLQGRFGQLDGKSCLPCPLGMFAKNERSAVCDVCASVRSLLFFLFGSSPLYNMGLFLRVLSHQPRVQSLVSPVFAVAVWRTLLTVSFVKVADTLRSNRLWLALIVLAYVSQPIFMSVVYRCIYFFPFFCRENISRWQIKRLV
jgi:hypothetical protein